MALRYYGIGDNVMFSSNQIQNCL